MPRRILTASLRLAGLAYATAGLAAAAQAADNTRYVSITGSNANACTLAAPCRTLQRGINRTPAGGELRILDSGFYGNNANVKKSLTISGNGNTVYLGNPITIDQASAVVALRGLVLDGQGTISFGVRVPAAASVHIERCVTHGFTLHGISIGGDGAKVFVFDSISRDNVFSGLDMSGQSYLTVDNSHFENNGSTGIRVGPGSAAVHRSTASGNISGFLVSGGGADGTMSVVSTVAANNASSGFIVTSGGRLTMESSLAHGNNVGLFSNVNSTARISNSIFTENATGISNSGAIDTRGNNTVRGNTDDFAGNALTPFGGT